jgi:hypothetical protein
MFSSLNLELMIENQAAGGVCKSLHDYQNLATPAVVQ